MSDYQAQLLAQLAEKLGTTVSHLWSVLILQARIEIFSDLLAVGVAAGAYFIMRALQRKTKVSDIIDEWGAPIYIGWIVTGLLLIIALFCVAEIPGLIFNPEYWALKQVLTKVGK